MKRKTELALPPFAWLTDSALEGRNVILHVRSASVVEMLEAGAAHIKKGVMSKRFTYRNIYGIDEEMIAVLHHSPLTDDRSIIESEILDPAIEYYKHDCDRQDSLDILEDGIQLQ